MASYERINYSVRPAKHIERKMMIEVVQKVSEVAPRQISQYVGFGSNAFADFILFHRYLGIRQMVSIEKDVSKEARFRLNLPFQCIELKMGPSSDKLSEVDWSKASVLWLDYDGKLSATDLEDVGTFFSAAAAGSVFFLSTNCETEGEATDFQAKRSDIEKRLGHYVPALTDTAVGGWNVSLLYRDIILEKIDATLGTRNVGVPEDDKLVFEPLIFFQYKDGAKMMTLGGYVRSAQEMSAAESPSMKGLVFATGREPFPIHAPVLSLREMLYLSTKLPRKDNEDPDLHGIPLRDFTAFENVYRYYPTYLDVDV